MFAFSASRAALYMSILLGNARFAALKDNLLPCDLTSPFVRTLLSTDRSFTTGVSFYSIIARKFLRSQFHRVATAAAA